MSDVLRWKPSTEPLRRSPKNENSTPALKLPFFYQVMFSLPTFTGTTDTSPLQFSTLYVFVYSQSEILSLPCSPYQTLSFSILIQVWSSRKVSLLRSHAAEALQKLPQRCFGWKRLDASRRKEAEAKYLLS